MITCLCLGQRQELLGRFVRHALQQQLILKHTLLAKGRRVVPEDVRQAAMCGTVGERGLPTVGGDLGDRPVVPGQEGGIPGAAAGVVDEKPRNGPSWAAPSSIDCPMQDWKDGSQLSPWLSGVEAPGA